MYGRCRRLQGGVVGHNGEKERIMSRVPGWLGRVGAGLTEMGDRLSARRAQADEDDDFGGRDDFGRNDGIDRGGKDGIDASAASTATGNGTRPGLPPLPRTLPWQSPPVPIPRRPFRGACGSPPRPAGGCSYSRAPSGC